MNPIGHNPSSLSSDYLRPNSVHLIKDTTASSGKVPKSLLQEPYFTLLSNHILSNPLRNKAVVLCNNDKTVHFLYEKLLETVQSKLLPIPLGSSPEDLREIFRNIDDKVIVLIPSTKTLLPFILNLLQIQTLDWILFDDLTSANLNHPYCVLMKEYYNYAVMQSFPMPPTAIPSIYAFAQWPSWTHGRKDENVRVRKERMQKLRQYQTLFHCRLSFLSHENCYDGVEYLTKDEVMEIFYLPSNGATAETITLRSINSKGTQTFINCNGTFNAAQTAKEYAAKLTKDIFLSFLKGASDHNKILLTIKDLLERVPYICSPEGPFHIKTIPSTTSDTTTSFIGSSSASLMLDYICSSIPKAEADNPVAKADTSLRRRTITVKRVDKDNEPIDSKSFFLSLCLLPSHLKGIIPLELKGLLSYSRISSRATLSIKAIQHLYKHSIIDSSFFYVADKEPSAMTIDTTTTPTSTIFDTLDPSENDDQSSSTVLRYDEIVPEPLQPLPTQPTTTTLQEKTLFIYKCPLNIKKRSDSPDSTDSNDFIGSFLSLSSLAHFDYFNTSENPLAILSFKELFPAETESLMPYRLRLGSSNDLVGSFGFVGIHTFSPKEWNILLDFQSFTFGLLNTRPITANGAAFNATSTDDEEDLPPILLPDSKCQQFFVAPLGSFPSLTDAMSYESFTVFCGNFTFSSLYHSASGDACATIATTTTTGALKINFHIMENVIKRKPYHVVGGGGGGGDIADNTTTTTAKNENKYSLAQKIIYTPYNGIFYRPFKESKDVFACSLMKDNLTFGEYFSKSYSLPPPTDPSSPLLEAGRLENPFQLGSWVTQKMAKAQGSSAASVINNTTTTTANTTTTQTAPPKTYLIPEHIEVLDCCPYWFYRYLQPLPSLIVELQEQLRCIQFYKDTFETMLLPPYPLMVQSLTGPSLISYCGYDYERMECYGDNLLKLYSTIHLYLTGPSTEGEGSLSKARQEMISNYTLYRKGRQLGLHLYSRLFTPDWRLMFSAPEINSFLSERRRRSRLPYEAEVFDGGREKAKIMMEGEDRMLRDNSLFYLEPCGSLTNSGHLAQDKRQKRHAKMTTPKKKADIDDVPLLIRAGGRCVPAKSLADLVESVICAFLQSSGAMRAAFDMMVHCQIIPDHDGSLRELLFSHSGFDGFDCGFGDGCNTRLKPEKQQQQQPQNINENPYLPAITEFPLKELEGALGYRFKDSKLAFQACTHLSACSEDTPSMERLEWLGDSVLDWMVTRYLFITYKDESWMTPERITDSRKNAVSNLAYATLCVRRLLYPFLRISSPSLQLEVGHFVSYIGSMESSSGTANMSSLPAPKVLGDLWEALAGAVLEDSGFSYFTVESVFLPLMKDYLEEEANPYDLPQTPSSEFWNDMRMAHVPRENVVVFLEKIATTTNTSSQSKCTITIKGQFIAEGFGYNNAYARSNAMALAVSSLRNGDGWKHLL